ncbi:hypothetical protein FB561_0756 [Kribbella amoyensis]|uniref:Uncharacterized protein n=1 Tax=Kribbella amoyensis TaxID=996641 RepID=A0A561BLL4_9ACTN|nr:hypothetical protein [Kribbella amoyensis]TWD79692.1 hypothetical protein FB561_0756 [Kribbella amoyensis]
MTDKDSVHLLLADLVEEPPPVAIDVDEQIRRGQRRRLRHLVTVGVAAASVPVVLLGAFLAIRPTDEQPVTAATPTASASSPRENSATSTESSRALLAEMQQLIPEIRQLDKPTLYDYEFRQGPAEREIVAGADRIYEGIGQITVDIRVSSKSATRQPCSVRPNFEPCTRITSFPDGTTAYLWTYTVPATVGRAYEVQLIKADGTGVSVSSAAQRPKNAAMPDAPLSLDRVLEIARQIKTTP